jgi:hypothetical protein
VLRQAGYVKARAQRRYDAPLEGFEVTETDGGVEVIYHPDPRIVFTRREWVQHCGMVLEEYRRALAVKWRVTVLDPEHGGRLLVEPVTADAVR